MTGFDWYIPKDKTDFSINDIVIETTVKLNISAFNELVKLSGLNETIDAIKPAYRNICNHFVLEAAKQMGLKGNGPDRMITTFMFGQATVVPPGKLNGEIFENGAIGIDYDCLFKRAPPEYCVFQSHLATNFVAEILDPSFECVFTHHLSNGDPYCRFVFKRKGKGMDDLGKSLGKVPIMEVPREQLQAFTIYGNHQWWQAITWAFVNLHGSKKTNEVLMANALGVGREVGDNISRYNIHITEDARSLGWFIDTFGKALNQKGKYQMDSNEIATKEITDCVCQVMMPEICNQYQSLFQGIVESINPDFEISYDRKMTEGEKTCHWTLRKKKPLLTKMDDPLAVLKLRLARGEINEGEYKRLKKLLEE